jgi:tRNA-splicing ligase RtcB
MAKLKITGKELKEIGFQPGKVFGTTLDLVRKKYKFLSLEEVTVILKDLLNNPSSYIEHEFLSEIANMLMPKKEVVDEIINLKEEGIDFKSYGSKNIERGAVEQMEIASKLPISIKGALMPDAHAGYGLPIGGVLATENSVIPFGVGVDIGCRMCMTIYDLPESFIDGNRKKLRKTLMDNTFFGQGSENNILLDNEVLDRKEFLEIQLLKNLKDKAWRQLGTSGTGNHFVEYGIVELFDSNNEFGLESGKYIGILTHSGSRGLGATVANTYTKIAMQNTKLPKEAKHLAWLDLNTQEGQEYWIAMNLAGDYASACHHEIHKRLSKELGIKEVARIENHHNFAWKETLSDGKEVIVHRKGATPAGKGVLGIIPGSMVHQGYIVRGKGDFDSINSASHGAGRAMSRKRAKETFTGSEVKKMLNEYGVTLIGGGIDEAPMAYKNIDTVMNFQKDLVDVLGSFTPKVVRMAKD